MESKRLTGDVAVVTGAASGIGKQTALTLAKEGAMVACMDINEAGVSDTVAKIAAKGGKAIAVAVDQSDSAQVAAAVKKPGRPSAKSPFSSTARLRSTTSPSRIRPTRTGTGS